jgi:hypothetical protein
MNMQSTVPGLALPTLSMTDRWGLFHVAFFTPGLPGESTLTWGLPLFLMGGVGVAKSTTTRDFARTVACPVEVFSPSERGDAEIGSVPVPTADAQWLTTPKPGWTRRFFEDNGGRGLILADELTTAEAHVQDALAGLVLDRRIAGSHLGGGMRVFAAGNPPGATGGGRPLAKMLANRLVHVPVAAPTPTERYEYLRARLAGTGLGYAQSVDAAREEGRVLRAWPDALSRAIEIAAAFHAGPGMDFDCVEPEDGTPEASGPFPTPRSWETAIRALAGCMVHNASPSVTAALLVGCVGQAAGTAFFDHVADLALPSIVDVLSGLAAVPDRPDRAIATLSAAVGFLTSEKGRVGALKGPQAAPECAMHGRRTVTLWALLGNLLDTIPDVAGIMASRALGAGLHSTPGAPGDVTAANVKGFTAVAVKLKALGLATVSREASQALAGVL